MALIDTMQRTLAAMNEVTGFQDSDLCSAIRKLRGMARKANTMQFVTGEINRVVQMFYKLPAAASSGFNKISVQITTPADVFEPDFTLMFASLPENIKSTVISVDDFQKISNANCFRMFGDNPKLESVLFLFYRFPIIARCDMMFAGDESLVSISGKMDVSKSRSFSYMFNGCRSLTEVYFKENSISYEISFSDSPNLIPEAIDSIINGLDSVPSPQTITLHPEVKAKLTEAQRAQIQNKNWTLA